MAGSPNDVWAVGEGPAGGAIWHWDGRTFERVLDTTARLYGIGGGPGLLARAVGSSGAMLELRQRR